MLEDEEVEDLQCSPRGRGRPRSTEVDEAILKAAWELLSEGRYDRLTFEAIADRAGCTRPTVYRRFRNKVDLVRSLVDPFRESMQPPLLGDEAPREALIVYLQGWVGYLAEGGGPAIMALWQARREDAEMSAMLDDIYDKGRAPYIEALRQMSARPAADEAYGVLVDAMLGAILFRCVHCLKPMRSGEIEALVDGALSAAARI